MFAYRGGVLQEKFSLCIKLREKLLRLSVHGLYLLQSSVCEVLKVLSLGAYNMLQAVQACGQLNKNEIKVEVTKISHKWHNGYPKQRC